MKRSDVLPVSRTPVSARAIGAGGYRSSLQAQFSKTATVVGRALNETKYKLSLICIHFSHPKCTVY